MTASKSFTRDCIPYIVPAQYRGNFRIRVAFQDGVEGTAKACPKAAHIPPPGLSG
jgi:hypothetical protein